MRGACMSTSSGMMTDGYGADMVAPARQPPGDFPRTATPIVPKHSISGRALVAVVAIMTFLASLTTGAVMLVLASAAEWQSDVAREMTIQIRPAAGRDLDARHCGGAALHGGRIGEPARAVAGQRARARRPAGTAHHRAARRFRPPAG